MQIASNMQQESVRFNKQASICWQDNAPQISGDWPTSEPNAG